MLEGSSWASVRIQGWEGNLRRGRRRVGAFLREQSFENIAPPAVACSSVIANRKRTTGSGLEAIAFSAASLFAENTARVERQIDW